MNLSNNKITTSGNEYKLKLTKKQQKTFYPELTKLIQLSIGNYLVLHMNMR